MTGLDLEAMIIGKPPVKKEKPRTSSRFVALWSG